QADAERRAFGSLEPREPARGIEQELTFAAGRGGVPEKPAVELAELPVGVPQHAGVDERVVELGPVVRAHLRMAAVEEQGDEDPVVDDDLRLLGLGTQCEQDVDRIARELCPGRPEVRTVCRRSDLACGCPDPAREQELTFPAAYLLRAPVD